eukprot:1904935-Alexandrium_andersonii.AAC.1
MAPWGLRPMEHRPGTWCDARGCLIYGWDWEDSARRKALHELRAYWRAAQLRAWFAQARPDSLGASFARALSEGGELTVKETEAIYRLFAWARGHAH